MGIQGFFGYFLSESNLLKPNKKFIIEESIDRGVKRLYVDFVNIVHDVLAENKDIDNGKDSSDKLIIEKVIERLATIFSYYPNSKKLIFFECIPTVAKMREQYSRRIFRKIQNDIEIDLKQKLKCEIESRFDQLKFAIDSDFIKNIILAIKDSFDGTDNSSNSNIEIFGYSNNEVGEAEHRIIHHIANTEFENNDVFVMYSPDADVFLLSTILTNLLSTDDKSLIVNTMRRSDDVTNRLFYKIDTQKYIEYLISKIDSEKNRFNIINDITYIFNLLGDDFIPIFDKFKTSHARDIFPVIFTALGKLKLNNILEKDHDDKLVIDKNNLIKVFEELEEYTSSKKKFKNSYKYILPIDENTNQIKHNKLIFMVLQDAFQKGYYFYERSSKSNHKNFYVSNKNYNKKFNNTNSNFLVYNIDSQKKQYEITINKSYKFVSMLEIDRSGESIAESESESESKSNSMIQNYFEGFGFILDLYYNTIGTVNNNFWYYRYNKSPALDETLNWLKNNDNIPPYDKMLVPPTYFTGQQYKTFLQKLIDSNYLNILKKNNIITYDSLIRINGEHISNKIFNCFEKKYINKCEIKNEQFFDPIEFIESQNGGKNKYYKKYLRYRNKINQFLTNY